MKVYSLFLFSLTFFVFPTLLGAKSFIGTAQPQRPQPVVRVRDLRSDERSIKVTYTERLVAENAAVKRICTQFVFTNPNDRSMEGEFEFPIPDEAVVCGYALEINGEMVQGVICEKEKARVAFENEVRKGVDPGLVEHVQGNLWKTRIFPLIAKTPRKAEVEYVVPKTLEVPLANPILEQDGDDFFLATTGDATPQHDPHAAIAAFNHGTILWDASLSAQPLAADWTARLQHLPKTGQWTLIPFRHTPDAPQTFTQKAELLATLKTLIYDGGTAIDIALQSVGVDQPTLLFTDEIDTLGNPSTDYETRPQVTIASRQNTPKRSLHIERLSAAQAAQTGFAPTPSTLLATLWAARRMHDLANQADTRKDEFLTLARRYGVAGPGHSLIVLETLEQWIQHAIEPPKNSPFYAPWHEAKATKDDAIASKREQTQHEEHLLKLWEERVQWWNDPIPKHLTPKSGVFGDAAEGGSSVPPQARPYQANRSTVFQATPVAEEDEEVELEEREIIVDIDCPPAAEAVAEEEEVNDDLDGPVPELASPVDQIRLAPEPVRMHCFMGSRMAKRKAAPTPSAAAEITLKAWDPKMSYLGTLNRAPAGKAYNRYLLEREYYATSPAFYVDCAGWFFNEGQPDLGERILTNLAEFKLNDVVLWRTMGWRLREAKRYPLAIHCFRKALQLRGEEPRSYRDLALILAESAKEQLKEAYNPTAVSQLEEALQLMKTAIFDVFPRQSGRRSNDLQIAIIALEELNGLLSWIEHHPWGEAQRPTLPTLDAVYRRDLPVQLRITMSWDADQTDIDLHILEPNNEEAYYGHRRTTKGGFLSEDVTTGYGPEVYLKKQAEPGLYMVASNYYASHQTALTGATTVSVTFYTNWGLADEKQRITTIRLDKPNEKYALGEITIE